MHVDILSILGIEADEGMTPALGGSKAAAAVVAEMIVYSQVKGLLPSNSWHAHDLPGGTEADR